MKPTVFLAVGLLLPLTAIAEEAQDKSKWIPTIHGTVRAKYEYQPDISSGRFEVRNARAGIEGLVVNNVSYKAEIDLSDEGKIKMLDAYAKITPFKGFDFTIGQMRVPFTIDAHRSPHQQYFANRSFIAKQVGNVRDVGATIGYATGGKLPVKLQAGLFNGSGLTDQKDYWTKSINYSVKAQFQLPAGFQTVLSVQKAKPESTSVYMYDAGITYKAGRWTAEVEYLYKHYSNDAFQHVNAFDGFACYDLPLKKVFSKISFLGRFDYMGDHSDGTTDDDGLLYVTDAQRKRITGGITLSMARQPLLSDIRINYEKYFYHSGVSPKVSEQDKIVVELVVRF